MHYSSRDGINGKDIRKIVQKLKDVIKEKELKFNTIVIQGLSGATIGFPLAMALGKNIAYVRKTNKHCHSSHVVEGRLWPPYLILDDFSKSGKTIKQIVEILVEEYCKIAGIILYDEPGYQASYFKFERKKIPLYKFSAEDEL